VLVFAAPTAAVGVLVAEVEVLVEEERVLEEEVVLGAPEDVRGGSLELLLVVEDEEGVEEGDELEVWMLEDEEEAPVVWTPLQNWFKTKPTVPISSRGQEERPESWVALEKEGC